MTTNIKRLKTLYRKQQNHIQKYDCASLDYRDEIESLETKITKFFNDGGYKISSIKEEVIG